MMSDELSHIVSRLIEKFPLFPGLSAIRDWERQCWAEVAKAIAEARQHTDREIHALVAELTKQQADWKRKWEEQYRYPYPRTLEDWYRLAVFAGLDATIVYQGQWTLRDVLPIVEGYLLRRNEMQKCNVPTTTEVTSERDNWTERIVKAARLVVGGKATAGLSRLIQIADSPDYTVEKKLQEIGKIGLLRPDVSASELAAVLRVHPSSIKKTQWWRNRMATRRQAKADEEAAYYHKRRR